MFLTGSEGKDCHYEVVKVFSCSYIHIGCFVINGRELFLLSVEPERNSIFASALTTVAYHSQKMFSNIPLNLL